MAESVASKRVLDPHPAATGAGAGAGIIGVGVFSLQYFLFTLGYPFVM